MDLRVAKSGPHGAWQYFGTVDVHYGSLAVLGRPHSRVPQSKPKQTISTRPLSARNGHSESHKSSSSDRSVTLACDIRWLG
jgi:hypothetical protein